MRKLLSVPVNRAGNLTTAKSRRSLAFFALFMFSTLFAFGQTRFVQLPPLMNGTSGASRAPNGSVDFHRGSIIYLGSEMPAVPANTTLTSVGFSINDPAATAATGNIKLYMVNTTDATNTRGTAWASIISVPTPMTLVYDGPLTIPATAGFYNITLSTPFNYTGGNIYLAYEWAATTKSAISAVYDANTDIAGAVISGTGTTLPATLSLSSAFRPVLRIGYTPLANDLGVAEVYTLGKLPLLAAVHPHTVRAAIVNTGSNAKSNVTVNLAITGANTFNTTATIANLPGGDTTVVTFPVFTPTAAGNNTVTVSVPANDDNVNNNTGSFAQIVTTNEISYAEGDPPVHTTALRPVTPNGSLLAKFNVNAPIYLPSVNMMISFHAPTVGQTIYAVVFNSAGTLVGRSPNYVVVNTDLSTMKNFAVTDPSGNTISLTAGDYYVGMAVVPGTPAFFPLGVQVEAPVRPGTFYTGPIAGGAPTELTSNYRLIIEPVLSTCLTPIAPTVTPATPAYYCTGSPLTLTASSTTPGVTYQWYRNGAPVAGATSTTLTVSTNGNYTVLALSSGCSSAPSNIVNVSNGTPAVPSISTTGTTTFCQGGGVFLDGATTATGVTYQWNRDGNPIAGATSLNYQALLSGSYTLSTTLNTCTTTSNAIVVTVTPKPATPTISQNGGTLTSSAATGNQWFFNGLPIAGATNQTHVTTNNGAYTVRVTDNGCDSDMSNLVNVTNTGLSDAMAGMSVQVFPNPANGSFNVKLNGYQQEASVVLYSLTGQQLLTEKVKAGQNAKNLSVKGLAAGTYLLKVTSDKGVQVTRLVIE